jgi:uncharacterized MnhB-related membrane protein
MRDLKRALFAAEAVILLVLGAAEIISGQLLGAAILVGIASLAAGCAWALWPNARTSPSARADE